MAVMDPKSNFLPPVNNALLPDIYNKLDADLQERTRVVNTQLDKRLLIQERIISKSRKTAERMHNEETIRMRQELVKIGNKLPVVGNIKNFSLAYFTRKKKPAKKKRGIPEEKVFMPFCERHFIHHLPTKKKFYKRSAPSPQLFPIVIDSARSEPPGNSLAEVVDVLDHIATDRGPVTENSAPPDGEPELQMNKLPAQRVFPASR